MEINAGDTAWVLASAALVMLMTPALGFFYGGLVRRKNVLGTIMHSFFILALISVLWVLCGYTLAFGPDHFGLIGGLDWVGFRGVGAKPNPDYAATIPHEAYAVFQMMFAIITPALITGAFAERKRFKAFVLFSIAWSLLVYAPIAHWVWAPGGWLHELGALDFAGGTVVHISSGVSALVAALALGKRVGFGAGIICFFAVDVLKKVAKIDDALDVFAVHGVGGIFGALATGLFARTAINDAGKNGLLYSNPKQLLIQAVAVVAVAAFAAVMTWGILKVIAVTVGLRVAEKEEAFGLDTTQHGEIAYQV
jgi:ammonia channel protein AmtB